MDHLRRWWCDSGSESGGIRWSVGVVGGVDRSGRIGGGIDGTQVLQSGLLLVFAVICLVEGALPGIADFVTGEIDDTQVIDVVWHSMADDKDCSIEYALHDLWGLLQGLSNVLWAVY